ncbi:hypothetical protein AVEN_191799-1 [Araneus ventricosus]|uniref:Uncharacterized protein n=1 Tax=Araneus ventricosus TaxID=182803 RepID=A0A4Y2MNH4_ARAVE|nr:hypothetical protein AVEN_191799-1 [Araneus ventricosus]
MHTVRYPSGQKKETRTLWKKLSLTIFPYFSPHREANFCPDFGASDKSQSGGGFSMSSAASSPSTSDKKKPGGFSNVVPVNIAQIHAMKETDEFLKIGSFTAKIISILGIVISANILTTHVTCGAEDLHLGCYVKAIGERQAVAFSVQPIQHLNEITMHMSGVIHASVSVAVKDKKVSF